MRYFLKDTKEDGIFQQIICNPYLNGIFILLTKAVISGMENNGTLRCCKPARLLTINVRRYEVANKNISEDTNPVNYRTVHLKFSDAEIQAIDLWQAQYKIRTRSEAIRQMIQQTLRASEAEIPTATAVLMHERMGDAAGMIRIMVREEVARALRMRE